MSELISIVYKPLEAASIENGFTRLPMMGARLVAGHGIEGDMKGGSAKRQLNIMAHAKVQQLSKEGFEAAPGQLGEQLIVSGIDVDALPVGSRLQIGDSAIIEVIEPRTGCAKFERYQARKPVDAAGRLGMMAIVVADGDISVGDTAVVL